MTPKERAAMQQALEALVRLTNWMNDRRMIVAGAEFEAITALREALAEPDMNLSCKSVQARLATLWGYVKAEQAEQEPVAWGYFDADGSFMDALGKQHGAYQTPLYAAPVRTKDLTDDEIEECVHIADSECTEDACMPWFIEFARAVIAADREKNKCQH